ncbi:helix-turn-helix domain-containing protein [Streptomyces kanamyceticus]|uniref:helix-turn-helix domain-containing protein n=1 Tax=Streptomyces kanamyceticus TaxID=1967 RepID=UPI001CC6B542|nr:helix-turn-helix transcriptional regulator [Streptomyces kanamyceticus]
MASHLPFGKRVRFYRERRDLHQWQLGELLNRSDDWVYRVESGRIPVNNVKIREDLAHALRVHVEDLQGAPTLLDDHNNHFPRVRRGFAPRPAVPVGISARWAVRR